jgi:hypothetical protein
MSIFRKLIFFLLFVSSTCFAQAQTWNNFPQKYKKDGISVSLNHDNTYILQYNAAATKSQLLNSFQDLHVPFEIELIDTTWRILSLHTQNDTHYGTFGAIVLPSKNKVFEQLNVSGLFDHVQYSHPVQKRKVPNDPNLFKQYQPELLKLYNVWENTVGGINRYGDTIVVAIIDDGYDTAHVDLKDNLFHNWNEIPNNGIDDDKNGYVDDAHGWNGVENNPYVFTPASVVDGHGTMVSGVFGAKGNNGKGVAGVNWTTKIMPLVYYPSTSQGDAEQGIIQSMIYAYKMKKLYRSSNKTKGANIVAINMSLGSDNAFPEDYPIWCSLYDSLGSVGIISISSATNRNVKVGMKGDTMAFGDIPTLCASKYLFSVNSSDNLDQHTSSGYSSKYVDLAAPGDNAFSTYPTSKLPANPYKLESGTSFASPLVAGAISLINASACKVFLDLSETNFDSAFGLYKLWLLNGVDKSDEFKNLNVSGGRLNVLTMWQQMDSWCWRNDKAYTSVKKMYGSNTLFQIYPNPTDGKVNIIFNENESQGRISIINVLGEVVFLKDFEGQVPFCGLVKVGNSLIYPVSLDHSQGTYFVKYEVNGAISVKKLIVQ